MEILKEIGRAIFNGILLVVILMFVGYFIVPIFILDNPFIFYREYFDNMIALTSKLLVISVLYFIIMVPFDIRRKKREKLEEEMMEYFRKQNEKEENKND